MDDKSALFLFKKNAVNSVNLKYNTLCVRVGRRIECGLIVFNAIKSARCTCQQISLVLAGLVFCAFVCGCVGGGAV